MANQTAKINPESMARVDSLLTELKDRAAKAKEAGDTFVFNVYVDILGHVSQTVTKARARAEREHLATIRKDRKALRKATASTTEE